MINDKARAILKLRTLINDSTASPHRRIQSAIELLARFGPSKRAVPLVKGIIRGFESYSDASLTKQRAVRAAVEQLQQNLQLALRTQAAQKDLVDEDDSVDDTTPSPEPTDAAPIESPEIGGLDLLPDPSDEKAWRRLLLSIGRSPRLKTKSELVGTIDVPLWIGECETSGRTPVNLARPADLEYHLADSELDWSWTIDLATEATPAARAAYRAESAALIHSRLTEFGIVPAGYIAIPDLIARLDAVYDSLQPPYVTFEQVSIQTPWLDPDDSAPAVKLTLTKSGEQRRFINLICSRISHGFDVYGRKSLGPVTNNLAVA